MSESLLDFDSWPPGIAQASIPANNNARRAEALAGSVISASTTAQPVSPAERDIYIIPPGATGTNWASFDVGDLVIYYDATWTAYAPFEGLRKRILDIDENWQFMGGSVGWAEESAGPGTTYTGTAGRIDVTGTVINIDPAYVGQNTITTLGTIATGTWNATAISAVYGGTGQTGYAVGDILFASTTTALSKLAAGTNGHVLTLAAGVPTWAAPASGMTNPMTTAGDLIVGGVSGAPARLAKGTDGQYLKMVSGAEAWAFPLQVIAVAISDETTNLTTGVAKVTIHMPYAFTLTAVKAGVSVAQTAGSILQFDINEAGASILSTKLTIDNSEKTSATAATPAVISDASLAADAEVTFDIDTVGTPLAKGAKIYLIGYPTP